MYAVAKLCYRYFMETQTVYYLETLKSKLSQRQRGNPAYSLRAFARDLGMHPGTLGKVIKGQRPLPVKISKQVTEKLDLSPAEQTRFIESLLRRKTNIDLIPIDALDERHIVDESNFRVIAEWEHFAVTDLFDIPSFEATIEDIANRLSISIDRSEVIVKNLMKSGLVKIDTNGKLERTYDDIKTTEDISSNAIRQSHKETLTMGLNKIEEIELELKDFSSMIAAVDLEQLTEAKTIIREFRQKMASLLRNGSNKTDLYQLAIQFYPVTNLNNSGEIK